MQRFRRRPHGDRGAVAVEAALVTPLLLFMIFGIIEFTLLLKDNVAVTSAVRAGSRTASAETRVPTFLDDTALAMSRTVQTLDKDGLVGANGGNLYIYEAQPNGWPLGATDDHFVCSQNCVTYNWDGTKFASTGAGSWDYRSVSGCVGDPNNPRTVVGVRLEYRHNFLTGLFGGGMTLSDESVQTFEPVVTVDDPLTQNCGPHP